jgi:ABC-type nickel/cobalt efflux system permease component RcnA
MIDSENYYKFNKEQYKLMIPLGQYSLISAFVIGLLHVLEPCEDKAVASLYVAWASKKLRESLTLIFLYGLGMLAIDTLIGFLISVIGVSFLQNFQPYFRIGAAFFTIVFGLLIIFKSHIFESHCYIKMFKDVKPKSKRSILLFGLVRGLPLCPIEVGILLWAASAGSVLYGTLLVLSFSIGTMISLIPFGIGARGVLSIIEKRAGKKIKMLAPVIVGLIIILMGLILLIE